MRKILFLFILFTFTTYSYGQTSLDQIRLDNGKYSVGFTHYIKYDSTRTYIRSSDWNNNFIPRPIPISIWYPSTDNTKGLDAFTILDYMQILKEEEEWEYLPDEFILNWFYYPNTPENQRHLKEVTTAFRNLKAVNNKFPVVLYAPSYQASSIENFALCEYLASHGYVVISSPSRGAESRRLEGGTTKDMEAQARDIEFLIAEAAKLSYVDLDKLSTIGFSFGGISNVLAQMRNRNIKAIVSLDGSVRYQYDRLQESPFFNIVNVDVPFIQMSQKAIPALVLAEDNIDPRLNTEFEFYDGLTYSQAYHLKFNNLTHSYFSSLGVLFQPRDLRQDKSDSEIMKSYHLMCQYTRHFLDAYLKHDKEGLDFMNNDPVKNGIAEGIVTHNYKTPQQKKITPRDFHVMASNQDYQNLNDLYFSIKAEHPSFELPEGMLNNLGLQLLFNPKTSKNGVAVLLFATTIYSGSANLYDSLAEAYLFIGDEDKARENFRKSLSLYAGNQNAINRLKELK